MWAWLHPEWICWIAYYLLVCLTHLTVSTQHMPMLYRPIFDDSGRATKLLLPRRDAPIHFPLTCHYTIVRSRTGVEPRHMQGGVSQGMALHAGCILAYYSKPPLYPPQAGSKSVQLLVKVHGVFQSGRMHCIFRSDFNFAKSLEIAPPSFPPNSLCRLTRQEFLP